MILSEMCDTTVWFPWAVRAHRRTTTQKCLQTREKTKRELEEGQDGKGRRGSRGDEARHERGAYFWSGLGLPLFLMLFAVVSLLGVRSTKTHVILSSVQFYLMPGART